MLLLWNEGIPYWMVGLGYAFVGIGVGFAGTPASRSLTASVPVKRAGMASGTADLQRDLGGALMQSIFGALLAAGFATAMTARLPPPAKAARLPPPSPASCRCLTPARRPLPSSIRSTPARSWRPRRPPSWPATRRLYRRDSSPCLSALPGFFLVFPKLEQEHKLLAEYHDIRISKAGKKRACRSTASTGNRSKRKLARKRI